MPLGQGDLHSWCALAFLSFYWMPFVCFLSNGFGGTIAGRRFGIADKNIFLSLTLIIIALSMSMSRH